MGDAMRRSILALVLSLISTAPAAAQWLDYPTPDLPRTADGKPNLAAAAPRTADDKPDLSGIWRMNALGYAANIFGTQPVEMLPWARDVYAKRSIASRRTAPTPTACHQVRAQACSGWSWRPSSFKRKTCSSSCTKVRRRVRCFSTDVRCRRIPTRPGWDIRSVDGRATRWSSKPPATTIGHGSTSQDIRTQRRCT